MRISDWSSDVCSSDLFPASYGLYGRPTTVNNTETFAAVPWIFRHSAQEFLDAGIPKAGGTKIFSVTGAVELPGNYDVPLGTPFSKLLELRSDARSVGKECVSTCRYRGWTDP